MKTWSKSFHRSLVREVWKLKNFNEICRHFQCSLAAEFWSEKPDFFNYLQGLFQVEIK